MAKRRTLVNRDADCSRQWIVSFGAMNGDGFQMFCHGLILLAIVPFWLYIINPI